MINYTGKCDLGYSANSVPITLKLENWKDLLAFNRAERRGIWLLLILIAGVSVIHMYLSLKPATPDLLTITRLADQADKQLEASMDQSIMQSGNAGNHNRKDSLFLFDPNTITAAEWELLGLSQKQAKAITRFTASRKPFAVPADLKKSFVISEDFYKRVEPWIRIAPVSQPSNASATRHEKYQPRKEDLNLADTTTLQSLPGIGSVLARRIVNYRKSLGGFHSVSQLREVFGIQTDLVEKLEKRLTVSETDIIRLDINRLSVRELSAHPYISPKLAYLITELTRKKPIRSEQELRASLPPDFPVNDNLWPYLRYRE